MSVDKTWLEKPRRTMVSGVSTPVLPLVAAWWHMLVHGTGHAWLRLKWLADVPAMVNRHPELVAPDVLSAAEAAGVDRCVAAGLLVAERVFGSFLEPNAREWARDVAGAGPLVRGSIRTMLWRPTSISLAVLPRTVRHRLALRADLRFRKEEVRRMLLEAGREWNAVDPGIATMVRGPARWCARRSRDYLRASAGTTHSR
jgi:hypothetical protein